VLVHPGDWVIGDADGVVVIEQAMASKVIEAGTARVAKEAQMMEALRGGATTVDLLGLDAGAIDR
jgi:4-hydroxy-4-methyl-2-oxoglutarate aldolase